MSSHQRVWMNKLYNQMKDKENDDTVTEDALPELVWRDSNYQYKAALMNNTDEDKLFPEKVSSFDWQNSDMQFLRGEDDMDPSGTFDPQELELGRNTSVIQDAWKQSKLIDIELKRNLELAYSNPPQSRQAVASSDNKPVDVVASHTMQAAPGGSASSHRRFSNSRAGQQIPFRVANDGPQLVPNQPGTSAGKPANPLQMSEAGKFGSKADSSLNLPKSHHHVRTGMCLNQFNQVSDENILPKRKPGTKSVDMGDLDLLQSTQQAEDSASSDSDADINDKINVSGPVSALLNIMMTLFEGRDIHTSQVELLSGNDKYIMSSLVARKFGITIQPGKQSPSEIMMTVNKEREQSKSKRLEENYKLVFKKALKYLLKKFKKEKDSRVKKQALEFQFYQHYFAETFAREKLEAEMNINPSEADFDGHALFNPKTINSKYVTNIMKSTRFREDFEDFLHKKFILDYNKSRKFKIQKVVEKCIECFNKKKGGGIEEVQKYIERNPKCKLPWSDRELVAARQSVDQLLKNKLKKEVLKA